MNHIFFTSYHLIQITNIRTIVFSSEYKLSMSKSRMTNRFFSNYWMTLLYILFFSKFSFTIVYCICSCSMSWVIFLRYRENLFWHIALDKICKIICNRFPIFCRLMAIPSITDVLITNVIEIWKYKKRVHVLSN
jgi:hypothetical protein